MFRTFIHVAKLVFIYVVVDTFIRRSVKQAVSEAMIDREKNQVKYMVLDVESTELE